MEYLKYTLEQIEKVLNIVNTIPVSGIDNCNKIVSIYQILNSDIKDEAVSSPPPMPTRPSNSEY